MLTLTTLFIGHSGQAQRLLKSEIDFVDRRISDHDKSFNKLHRPGF